MYRCIIRRLTRRARTPSTHCEPHELRTTAISLSSAPHNVRGQLLTATSLTIARHGSHDHRHRRDWHADDATVQSGDHQLTDGVAAHGRLECVHRTRSRLMGCAGAAVVSSLQCRHHGCAPRCAPAVGGHVSKVSKRGRSLWMAAALTCPLLNSSRSHTIGDMERHGDAMKAVRLDDTSCIVFLDVSLYRSCIDRYIML